MLGLLRWVYLVPALARADADPSLTPAQRAANAIVFHALHQYLGVGVGEHLGYLFTGIWSVLIGVAVIQGNGAPVLARMARDRGRGGDRDLLRQSSSVRTKSGDGLSPEPQSRPFYIAWSLWLFLAMGIALIV